MFNVGDNVCHYEYKEIKGVVVEIGPPTFDYPILVDVAGQVRMFTEEQLIKL